MRVGDALMVVGTVAGLTVVGMVATAPGRLPAGVTLKPVDGAAAYVAAPKPAPQPPKPVLVAAPQWHPVASPTTAAPTTTTAAPKVTIACQALQPGTTPSTAGATVTGGTNGTTGASPA